LGVTYLLFVMFCWHVGIYSAIGGTCVNVGCVPKKLMVYGSMMAPSHDLSGEYGWESTSGEPSTKTHNWKKFIEKKNAEISRLNGIYGRILGNAGVKTYEGRGAFKSSHEVLVTDADGKEEILTAETILIATGGWPFIPDVPGAREHAVTSNELFYLEERPERIVIVGGGYIAVEFACIFSGFGSKVDLMYRRDLFLRGFDFDVRKHLASELEHNENLSIHFKTDPAKIEKNADGTFTVTTKDGEEFEADLVVFATGRNANTDKLNLEAAGVKSREGDFIPVNEYSRTNVDNIYAVGDVTDRIALTPVALHEGHCFADTMYSAENLDRKPDHEYVPSAVFSQPEIGSCGLPEHEAVEKHMDVTVFMSTFKPMLYTMTDIAPKMLMKIIVETKTDKVVGVHIVGEHAAEMIQGVAIAMKMGATKKDFDKTIGLHPSSAEELVTMRSPSYFYKNGEKVAKL